MSMETRSRILDAARACFIDSDYEQTTIARLELVSDDGSVIADGEATAELLPAQARTAA